MEKFQILQRLALHRRGEIEEGKDYAGGAVKFESNVFEILFRNLD